MQRAHGNLKKVLFVSKKANALVPVCHIFTYANSFVILILPNRPLRQPQRDRVNYTTSKWQLHLDLGLLGSRNGVLSST